MYSKVYSAGLMGMEGFIVEVEADISNGLPCVEFVGTLGAEVKEARERVKAALHHYDIAFPPKRITVNLSPGDRRKEGCGYDLPIAVVLLQAMGYLDPSFGEGKLFLGELALDGKIRALNGVLPLVIKAKEAGFKSVVLPEANAEEGALVEGIDIYAVSELGNLPEISQYPDSYLYMKKDKASHRSSYKDFSDVLGQEILKRAALIAATGLHNLLITGPPGAGKTMIAERIPGILPDLDEQDKLELTKIYSVCGKLKRDAPLISERPFRYVHHTMTVPSLLGGGRNPHPGEVSLAHKGVLFMDEAPEFDRAVLEALRQPLETGEVTVSRLNGIYTYPSKFMLVASMNLCPCGYYPDREKCTCTQSQILRYMKKVSGPMLDRIDISVEARKVKYENLTHQSGSDSPWNTQNMKERVAAAVEIQKRRFRDECYSFNAHIPSSDINKYCNRSTEAEDTLKQVYEQLHLSARSYHKLLKVSRTIADLDDADEISVEHISEALSLKLSDAYFSGLT